MLQRPSVFLVVLGLCLLLVWSAPLLGAPAAKAPAVKAAAEAAAPDTPKGDAPKGKGDEASGDKLDKQLAGISDRLTELMNEDMNLAMSLMGMQQKANELVESPDKATEELSKGVVTPKLREYKQVLLQSAQRLQALDAKYGVLQKTLKTLERDREHATTEQQARLDDFSNRLQAKHRANVAKIAVYYEKAAEPKLALQIFSEVYQSTPEKQRDRALKERVGNLSEKAGNYKDAITLFKSILDALPEKDRYHDRALGEKLGGLYEKAGDYKAALALYQAFLNAMPADKRDTDGKTFRDRIANIEKKGGRTAPAARDSSHQKRY
jgi:tetratricopeptide (TPR) repeat protein